MSVDKLKFGKSDLQVSPIAFGGNVFGWTLNEAESFRILDELYDHGFNFIDTADSYSIWVPGHAGGESETIIGKWMKTRGNRNEMVIATKLGTDLGNDKKGLSAKYMKEAVEASLSRLQTDYIDLYQSHQEDPNTEVGETIESFNSLIKEGKVRYIGASNFSSEKLKASNDYARDNGLHGYISLQPNYNLIDRQPFEKENLDIVREEGLAVMNYFALASGFLTGKYRSEEDFGKSPRGYGMSRYLDGRGLAILDTMDQISAETQRPLSQIALAWLLSKDYITTPIASATSPVQLKDLVDSVTLKLSDEQLNRLDKVSGEGNV